MSVRTITTHEGKFLNLDDMKKRIQDPAVLRGMAAICKVGKDKGDDPWRVFSIALCGFLADCAEEVKLPKV
jgi:hypothetical protein